MKSIFLLYLLSLISLTGSAQTWDEWFHQEWTHNEYSKQQIYGLWAFLGKVSDGVEIVSKGLTTISNITDGNLNLHRDFFGSLKNFNPRIYNKAKVIDILAFQTYIIRDMSKVYDFCQSNENFSAEEIRYIAKVHSNLLVLTDLNLTELLMIIRSGQTQMTDGERLQRIDRIYEDLRDQRAFVRAFGDDAQFISKAREKEKIDLAHNRHLHDAY